MVHILKNKELLPLSCDTEFAMWKLFDNFIEWNVALG